MKTFCKFRNMILAAAAIVWLALRAGAGEEPPSSEYLWYGQPAAVQPVSLPWAPQSANPGNLPAKRAGDPWESQSLPVGNGRVGGTVFGGDRLERVNLNEVSLWTGGSNAAGNGRGYAYGPLAGKDAFGSYQPFGNLYISFVYDGESTGYRRWLDLRSAVAGSSFSAAGVAYRRECYASRPDNVLAYEASASQPGKMNARIALAPCHSVSYRAERGVLIMSGVLANGEQFEGRVSVRAVGGSVSLAGKGGETEVAYEGQGTGMRPVADLGGAPYFEVRAADSFVVYVALATNYKMDDKAGWVGEPPATRNERTMAAVAKKEPEAVRKAHLEDYRSFYGRLSLDLGKTEAAVAALPTDRRLAAYRSNPGHDPELEATVYQYGRYLLIEGSQPGNLPANLQGIWNDKVHAAWACDYHNNINLQMCYWGAEVANLSSCHMPLISFVQAMAPPLREMTKKEFGEETRGWTSRISQNPWGGGGWKKWNAPVNAWYALHVWDHYLFTQDKTYLKEVAYPILKDICHFWEDRLKELGAGGAGLESDGKPVDVSSYPELAAIKAGTLVAPAGWSHEWGPVEDGIAHDQQLIWELFDNTAKAADILGADAAWATELRAWRDRLAGNRIAPGGYLQEWLVDRPGMVRGHRHTSHLIGVFPGTSISKAKTPELAAAAMKSLELRGLSNDNRRSWTWPWRAALWARFGKADRAYDMVQGYICHNLLDNLFGNHPPMQMDGAFGMTGGMSEMLIQSHAGRIELLPALPPAWKNGAAKGIRARGDLTVDMEWKDGKVVSYALRTSASDPQPVEVVANGKSCMARPEALSETKRTPQ